MSNGIRNIIIDKMAIVIVIFLLFFFPLVGHTSALVYVIAFTLFFTLGFLIDNIPSRIPRILILIMLIAGTTMFAGFRDFGIGTDTNVYIMRYFRDAAGIFTFNDLVQLDFHGDKGFLGLACISRFINNDPQFFLFCIAFVINTLTFLSISLLNSKEKKINWSTFLFLWLFSFYNMTFNAMRQYCAMSILLFAFVLLLNGKWKLSLPLVIPAYFFHSSSIIFLPIFIFFRISHLKDSRKRNIIMALFILISLVCVVSIFKILPALGDSGIIAEGYADVYGNNSYYKSANLFGPTFLISYSIILYIIWITKQRKIISEQFATMALGIHAFYFILRLTAFNVIFLARLSEYYFYCDILIIAMIISKGLIPQKLKFLYYTCIVYTWTKGYIFSPGGETYPYISSILGISG